jgi:hypothetical protein
MLSPTEFKGLVPAQSDLRRLKRPAIGPGEKKYFSSAIGDVKAFFLLINAGNNNAIRYCPLFAGCKKRSLSAKQTITTQTVYFDYEKGAAC